jgi:hypothetical protein
MVNLPALLDFQNNPTLNISAELPEGLPEGVAVIERELNSHFLSNLLDKSKEVFEIGVDYLN